MLSRTSRILLVVAAVAVIAYLLIDRASENDGDDASERLGSFDPQRVDGIIVERGHETLRFVREDSLWRMTAPVADTAERNAVMPLLDALARAGVARNLGPAGDVAPFGLDPPLVRIVLLAGADTLLHASVGKRTVDDAWCYAHTARSRDLLLIPTNVARAATLPVDSYRRQRVVDFQLADVAAYSLRTPRGRTAWRRQGEEWFTLEHGDTIRGDSVAVEGVLRRLRGLRAASFIAAPDTSRGELMATISVQIFSGLHETVRLALADSVWMARTGTRAVILNDEASDLVAHTTTGLRDRRLLQFSPPEAARIELNGQFFSGTLVRMGGLWASPNPSHARPDREKTAEFVRALRALKWDTPLAGKRPSRAETGLHVVVRDEHGTILDEMQALSTGTSSWYVTSHSSAGEWTINVVKLTELEALMAGLFGRAATIE